MLKYELTCLQTPICISHNPIFMQKIFKKIFNNPTLINNGGRKYGSYQDQGEAVQALFARLTLCLNTINNTDEQLRTFTNIAVSPFHYNLQTKRTCNICNYMTIRKEQSESLLTIDCYPYEKIRVLEKLILDYSKKENNIRVVCGRCRNNDEGNHCKGML